MVRGSVVAVRSIVSQQPSFLIWDPDPRGRRQQCSLAMAVTIRRQAPVKVCSAVPCLLLLVQVFGGHSLLQGVLRRQAPEKLVHVSGTQDSGGLRRRRSQCGIQHSVFAASSESQSHRVHRPVLDQRQGVLSEDPSATYGRRPDSECKGEAWDPVYNGVTFTANGECI